MVLNKSKRWLLVAVTVLVAALMLAACAPDDEGMPEEEPAPLEGPTTEGEVGVESTPEGEMVEPTDEMAEEMTEEPTAEGEMEEEPTAEGEMDEEMTEEPMAEGEGSPYLRTSTLIGLQIVNVDGEVVGEIEDAFATEDGSIEYIMFDAADVLGGDQHYVLIPWNTSAYSETGQMGEMTDDTPVPSYGLNEGDVSEDQPAVDPATFDNAGLTLDADEDDVDAMYDGLMQLSHFDDWDLSDYNLVNENGDDLGEVEGALIDASQGTIVYAVADVGGFLGIGENSIAIPWDRLSFDAENNQLVLPVSEETLADAPIFDPTDWELPNVPEMDWDEDIRSFWEGITE